MPGTNQFLPFAVGAGANTLTPTAYAALTSLLSGGFVAGVANSAQFNTALRQATTAAAGLAEFIANQNINVNDDGSKANFAAGLTTALQAMFVGVSSFTGANQSLGSNGWQRLPGGLILQWGSSAGGVDVIPPTVGISITFPLAFTSACYQVVGTLLTTGGSGANGITSSGFNLTGCSFTIEEWAAVGQGAGVRYIAIGR